MDTEKEPMYTKSTFPEMEKMEAANSMLARIILLEKDRTSPTESFRKELLYDLAAMNSMVPKGYGPQTSADTLIYSVKQIACEAIARKWAERCRYYQGWSTHGSILYVYAGGRQYSFHVNLYDFDLPAAKYEEWDHIEKGWALTDEEYARERRARSAERLNTDGVLREYQTYREERLKNYKVAKEYIRNRQKRKRLEERFWEVLLSVLPPAKKKNKCVNTKDLHDCLNRYEDLVKNEFSKDEMTFLKYESLWGDYWEDYFDKSKVEKKRIDWITDDLLNNKKLSLDLLGGSYLKFEKIIKSRSKDNIGW